VLYGYFAISGNQEMPACCICGFIAEAENCESFDRDWKLTAKESNLLDTIACLHCTDNFKFSDIFRLRTLLADLAEVLTRSSLVPMGVIAMREDFFQLSYEDRAVLAGEGIEDLLNLVFYVWTDQIICRAHEQSEKVSLLLGLDSLSTVEEYGGLFNKHMGRYLLGPHLTGALAFATVDNYTLLLAAKLLSESVLLISTQNNESACSLIPQILRTMIEQIHQSCRFGSAGLHKLIGRLKDPA
jgi:hypothetical protein